jgi:hypothetical protein
MPATRSAYLIPINSVDSIYEWACPKCSRRFRGSDKGDVEARAKLHGHGRGPSREWAPRYRMPPRYNR